jgi:hypothetical protein
MAVLSRALTTDEYQSLDWFPLIQDTQWDHYRWTAAQRLHEKANDLTAQGQEIQAQALSLIGGVISMQLRHGGPDPYGPMIQMRDGGRTLSFRDLEAIDADFLGQVARDTRDPWLRARFSDIAASVGQSSGVNWQLGKLSVEAQLDYLRSVFLTDRAIDGIDECRRALRLLWVYAKRDESLWDAYWNLITEQVQHSLDNNWSGVAFPLCDEAMERNRKVCEDLAPIVQAKADSLAQEQPIESARYYAYASRLWHQIRDKQRSREAKLSQGETLVRAAAVAAEANPLIAPHWMLEGISLLRRAHAPRSRINELRDILSQYQLASLDSFHSHEFSIDVSDWVKQIEDAMIGPSFFDALLQMSFRLERWLDFDQCRQQALETAEKYALSSLFSSQHSNDEGAIVATEQAFDRNNEESVFQRMVSQARETHLDLRGRVLTGHATSILYSNFQPPFSAVKEIVDASPMTPASHSETLARGLYAGICDDWVAASAYLIPLVEPLVRAHLRRRGIHTTVIRENGTQQERTLSELLAMPEATHVFGAGLLLELRATLTEPLGFNLRNMYCHGLLHDNQLTNPGIMSLWWSLWRLTLIPWREHPTVIAHSGTAPIQ